MKKLLALCIAITFILGASVPAFAEPDQDKARLNILKDKYKQEVLAYSENHGIGPHSITNAKVEKNVIINRLDDVDTIKQSMSEPVVIYQEQYIVTAPDTNIN